jgi:hypothetical protein
MDIKGEKEKKVTVTDAVQRKKGNEKEKRERNATYYALRATKPVFGVTPTLIIQGKKEKDNLNLF